MVDYFWFKASKYDGWVLIGAWAAIRMNTDHFVILKNIGPTAIFKAKLYI